MIHHSQPFWGNMVAARGAGPKPIPHKQLNAQNLADAITFCLTPEANNAAQEIAYSMQQESGVRTAVQSFHANLPFETLTCDILPDHPASWIYKRKKKSLKLSKVAVEILITNPQFESKKLELYESKPVHIETKYYDPVSGATTAYIGWSIDVVEAAAGMVTKPYKEYKVGRTNTSVKSVVSGSSSLRSSRSSSSTQVEFVTGEVHDLVVDSSASSSVSSRSHSVSRSEKSMDVASTPGFGCTAARMAGASAKSFGDLNLKGFKGLMVDIPLATAEGLRNVPALYGDKPRDHGTVTDWKSGALTGGKAFVYGVGEGLTDIFVEPYKGGKKEGALGKAH